MADVTLEALRKSFGTTEAICGVDLDIGDGELVVFVGPSGCGKSTLLRLIAGLETISAGELRIGGAKVNHRLPAQRGVAMVFQSYALYPHMTVYDNMAFGLKIPGGERGVVRQRVEDVARTLKLDELLDRLPRQLSGGQRQRVAMGRAIVRRPDVFLFDEPLSNLDAALRVEMRVEIARLHRELGTTLIYVTHDQIEAMTLADKIVVLNDGAIEQVGSPLDLYHHPVNLFVARFIGAPQMNLIDVEVSRADSTQTELRLADGTTLSAAVDGNGLSAGQKLQLGIRPEALGVVDGEGQSVNAESVVAEPLGESTLVHVCSDAFEGTRIARFDGARSLAPGSPLRLRVDPGDCHLFDAEGRALSRHFVHRSTAARYGSLT